MYIKCSLLKIESNCLGSDNVGPRIMQDFLTTHKKLRFLGLMHMDDCGLAMFTVPTHPLYNPDLVVSII